MTLCSFQTFFRHLSFSITEFLASITVLYAAVAARSTFAAGFSHVITGVLMAPKVGARQMKKAEAKGQTSGGGAQGEQFEEPEEHRCWRNRGWKGRSRELQKEGRKGKKPQKEPQLGGTG